MVPALLKWVGSKQRTAETIVDLFPKEYRNYHEPFLGSGAILAEVRLREKNELNGAPHRNAFASDNLPFLIDIFNQVKDEPSALSEYYKTALDGYLDNPKEAYLTIRERFNANPNANDFCVLTRTCYSGIIRFRKKDGYMSTPVGAHKPISSEEFERRAELWHGLIEDVTFTCQDFKTAMRAAEENDLIYCDPPYTHSQSILYGAQQFNIEELWEEIRNCKERGCFVALSINGSRKSGAKDISPTIPKDLFEHQAKINCGISMIDRFQNGDKQMSDSEVRDLLLLTW